MPYDPMGSGYGRYSRGNGEYGARSIYGYGDQGAFYNPQQAQQYQQAQQQPQPAPSQSPPPQQQQPDFFSQLAGLMGAPPAQPAMQMSPSQYNYNQALYGNQNAMAQSAASHAVAPRTYGGRGEFAGQAVQYGARGGIVNPYASNSGRASMGRTSTSTTSPTQAPQQNPLENMPKPGRPMAAPSARKPVATRNPTSAFRADRNPVEGRIY